MDSKRSFKQSDIIAGPPLMGIEANWEANHPEDGSGTPYHLPFVVEAEDGPTRPGNRVIGILVGDYTPHKTDSGETIVTITGSGIEVPLGNSRHIDLGEVAVLNYNPSTNEGVMMFSSNRTATKE
jgi:hypothetical protein